MQERTSPTDAIERLAWHLNYHDGETVSLNHLAEVTDLSWATVHKYTQTIETLGRIAPRISVTNDGIEVNQKTRNMAGLFTEDDLLIVVYLIVHAEIEGNPTEPLDIDKHADVLKQHQDTIEDLVNIGWIKRTDSQVQLTPAGIGIAGRTRSETRNLDKSFTDEQVEKLSADSEVNSATGGDSESPETTNNETKAIRKPSNSTTGPETDEDVTIESRLAEQEYFSPPDGFVEQANVSDPEIYDRFDEFPEGFEEYAEMLDWNERWDTVLDDSNPPFYEWFVGGKLNAAHNCVDRHTDERGDETAILWEGEEGEAQHITYNDLHERVNEMAAVLQSVGVEEDDIVTIHLPMVPALPVTMLACARIGAPHSVVFAGFSANALAERVNSAESDHVVTIDGYYRRGDFLDHVQKTDEALEETDRDPEVLAWTRHDEPQVDVSDDYTMVSDLLADHQGETVEPVSRNAEDPLFLMYTSGTTGQPKGCQHRTGGYLAYVTGTSKYVEDIKPEDTYWCSADIGWITGHSYIVYGPLALGTTTVMYEGTPDYPEKDRTWQIAEEYDVDIFHTSPTAVRQFMKWGEQYPEGHDFDFRHMTTVGEPIQPEAWLWYYQHIGDESAVIVDTWWQTETGGHMITNLPAIQDMKPGSAGHPAPGIKPAILDDDGEEIEAGSGEAGNLAIMRPWPGMLQTVYGNDERFISEYWERLSDTDSEDSGDWVYEAGDGAVQTEDGYYRILGRLDDVINVAGHRLGTMELESAVAEVEDVAEAAVVPRKDDDKGEVPDVYVTLKEGVEESKEVRERIAESVEEEIGSFARPANVMFVDDLPKTRSGKIMRRLLEKISNDEELGNMTALGDPNIAENIRDGVKETG